MRNPPAVNRNLMGEFPKIRAANRKSHIFESPPLVNLMHRQEAYGSSSDLFVTHSEGIIFITFMVLN